MTLIDEKQGNVKIVDESGEQIFKTVCDKAWLISPIEFLIKQDRKFYLYLYKGGQLLIKREYKMLDLSLDRECYIVGGLTNAGYAFSMIKDDGSIVNIDKIIEGGYNGIQEFSKDLIIIDRIDLYGLMSKRGEIVVPVKYKEIKRHESGHILLSKWDNNMRHGLIDDFGNVILPTIFSAISAWFNKITVCRDGKWGVTDLQGKFIIECEYDDVYASEKGVIEIKKNNRWGLTDANGKILIPIKYDNIGRPHLKILNDFCCGMETIELMGKMGAITTSGNEIIPPIYDKVTILNAVQVKVEMGNYAGLYNHKGEQLTGIKYHNDSLHYIDRGIFLVQEKKEHFLLNKYGEEKRIKGINRIEKYSATKFEKDNKGKDVLEFRGEKTGISAIFNNKKTFTVDEDGNVINNPE